ncbi:hypothetical protein [Natronorubrum aibiense]|uniref:Uncharacterized protein n=1 Tax=Natronorubrum aibiense TaxID=348826 RepID=A0A5P9P951_9EURY|nr:hypothetical protein [Natronorubrum aibiense]QFU84642.1 hypothetical protein GCU68_19120 [Natronorubrum aibiense]
MTPTQRVLASLSAMKNPAYTGEHRCIPCTLLNLVIAAATAAVIVLVATAIGAPFAFGTGIATLVGAVAIIYFRGYIVPGTPMLTKQYFPSWIMALFDTEPSRVGWIDDDPQAILLEIGVVVDDPNADDVALESAFVDEWERSIAIHRTDDAAIKRSLGWIADIEPDRLEFETKPHAFVVQADGVHLANWPSRAACVADAAAARAFSERDPDWERRPLSFKTDLLGVLRLFLERCPTCDGSVALSQDVVESCCRTRDVVAATCTECNARLFEMDVDPDTFAGSI